MGWKSREARATGGRRVHMPSPAADKTRHEKQARAEHERATAAQGAPPRAADCGPGGAPTSRGWKPTRRPLVRVRGWGGAGCCERDVCPRPPGEVLLRLPERSPLRHGPTQRRPRGGPHRHWHGASCVTPCRRDSRLVEAAEAPAAPRLT